MHHWQQNGPDFLYTLTHEDNPKKAVNRLTIHVQAGKDEDGQRVSQAEVERVTQILLTALQNSPDYLLKLQFKDDPHEQEHSYFTREAAECDLACYDRDALLTWYLIDPDGVILDSN